MVLLELATALLIGFGAFSIISDYVHWPTPRARKAILAHKQGPKGLAESIVIPLSQWISKRIKLSGLRKDSIQRTLYSAEIDMTPEFYVAKAISSGLLVAFFAVPMFFILPFMSLMFLVLALAVFVRENNSAEVIIAKKREKIERELVLFASTIQQNLTTSRDVIKIFESYRKVCGPELTHELDVTIADMKTGNYESALRRFEQRINSAGVSQLIRGLLAVMRGDEQTTYFEILAHDLMVEEKERMKREALARPGKLKIATVLMIGCFALVYFYAIGHQIYTTLQKTF